MLCGHLNMQRSSIQLNLLFSNAKILRYLVKLANYWIPSGTTHIAGLGSHGLMLGTAVAVKKKLPFVVVDEAIEQSQLVLITGVLTTGNTAKEAINQIEKQRATTKRLLAITQESNQQTVAAETLKGIPFTVLL